ncbi:MAG: signal recognition particle-docking protein FtsY [Rickettsiales bacterium]|jgi:fused signal recognition particle receptor|nr:signal recognition particle-docking protein FtsY [Rickettsiales bacterium]
MSIFDNLFARKRIKDDLLDDLENLLISGDIGLSTTENIINELRKGKYTEEPTLDNIKDIVASGIRKTLENSNKQLKIDGAKPFIITLFGMNGAGKTTTIVKLANKFKKDGKRVIVAAADTFRIGAVEQLAKWCKNINIPLIQAEKEGQDPTSVAYKALQEAKKNSYDILLIDTAGRTQNNINLMTELQKIVRVIGTNESIVVLDASIGQNALKQVEQFGKAIKITGIIVNKFDGTAKGGILVPIYEKTRRPIYAIGTGEKIDDIKDFDVDWYIDRLLD